MRLSLSLNPSSFAFSEQSVLMEQVIGTDELQPGGLVSVFVDDIPALAVRLGDEYFVIEDVCSHDGQPLADGEITDGAIACPRHGAKFDLKTGAALCMPATKGVRTFDVEIRDNAVWAALATGDSSKPSTDTPSSAASAASNNAAATASTEVALASEKPAAEEDSGDKEPTTASDYIEALKQVIDPELMINIVDLGLIYSVEQDEETAGKVSVDMTLTSPACPAGPQLVQQAKMSLERLHDVSDAVITLVMAPPWSPERMTDDARDQLGIF